MVCNPEEGKAIEKRRVAANLCAIHHLRFFYYARNTAGKVIFAVQVHAGHFGRFSADQSAPVRLAPSGNSADYLHRDLRLEFTGGQIVEEKEGLRALYGYIVYAVVYQVFADRVVAPRGEGDLELGSHAVHGAYKHGLAHFRFQRET